MEKTEQDVEHAYVLARRVAAKVVSKFPVAQMDIEDLVQDAMMGWLEGQNMGHAIMDGLRRQFGQSYRISGFVPQYTPYSDEIAEMALEDPTEQTEDKTAIVQALENAVPDPRARRVIWLYFFEGRTTREIAEIEDISKSRVDQIKHVALSQLKEALSC